MKTSLLTIVPLFLLATACLTGQNATLTLSSFKEWQRISVANLGFTVEVPKDRKEELILADSLFIKNSGCAMYQFSLHPIHISAGVEDLHVIDAFFAVMTPDQYRLLCERKGYGSYYKTYASTIQIFHQAVKEYHIIESGVMGASVFRRDIIGSHGQVVSIAIVRKDYADAEKWRTDDFQAIKRIINSVEIED
jgi:hypothetical protein